MAIILAPFATGGYEFIVAREIATGRTMPAHAIVDGVCVLAAYGPLVGALFWIASHVLVSRLAGVWPICAVLLSDLIVGPWIEICLRALQVRQLMRAAGALLLAQAAGR